MSINNSAGNNVPDSAFDFCIWGGGLSGYTLAAAFGATGRRSLIIDTDPAAVDEINSGNWRRCALSDTLLGQNPRFAQNIVATHDTNPTALGTIRTHIVCVPTERAGEAWNGALLDVAGKIALTPRGGEPLMLIICSTVAPDWIENVVHRSMRDAGWQHPTEYGVVSSPRRDVFYDASHCLSHISIVVGADSPLAEERAKAIFGSIYAQVHVAPDARHASLVKVVENLHRLSALELTNRLSAALPGFDMAEIFRLAGSKWNMEEYRPSLGIGGNCVPVARSYVLESITGERSWFESLGRDGSRLRDQLVDALTKAKPFRQIGIMGLAYAPGLKVHTFSPALNLIASLKAADIAVRVHDPLYDRAELENIAGAARLDFPSQLGECDCIILNTAHKEYLSMGIEEIARRLTPGTVVIDNCGLWRGRSLPNGLTYLEVGSRTYFEAIARWTSEA